MHVQTGDARRLLGIQAALIACTTGVFFFRGGIAEAQAALFGGATALVSAWLLQRRVKSALAAARDEPGSETRVLYIGAVQRFIVVFALFMFGLGGLKLQPIPLLICFAVAQAAYIVAGNVFRIRTDRQAENF